MAWIERHPVELPVYTDALNLDVLEPGRLHRLAIALVDGGASQAIRVPVLVVRGASPGPTVGLTAAIHGNELNGIVAIQRLFQRIDPEELQGTLVGVTIANMPAYVRHQRVYADLADLNRTFPGRPDGNESQLYAWRLFERIVARFHLLLDLHTASFGRVNTFYIRADLGNPTTARLARLIGAQILLHNPSKDGTLRGEAESRGIPAVTVEIGDPQSFDRELIRASRIGLRDVLESLNMVAPDEEQAPHDAITCVRSKWLYTDTGGILTVIPQLAEQVRKGQRIARLVDPWGQLLRTYNAPFDGIVIGKADNPVARAGSRILHLGVIGEVSPDPDPDAFDLDEFID